MPPPRDRLGAMQSQAYFEEGDYNIPMDDDMDPKMQEFFHQIEQMRDTATQVQNDINKVKKLQNDILSSPMVDAKAKQELDDTMNAIKKKANTIRTGLKSMEVAIEQEEKNNPNAGAQLRMKKTQHMAVSKTFIEMMTEYNKIQTDFRDDSKAKIGRQMELAGANVTDADLEDMLEKGEGAQLLGGHIQIEGNAEELKATLGDIQERHEMFQNLEKSITELHEMFVDIASMMEAQGEMINRIDVHVTNATDYNDRGIQDTKEALKLAYAARRKKIMMLLCIVIGGPLVCWIGLKYMGIM